MVVEVVNGKPNKEYCAVRILSPDGSFSAEGLVPSTHLALKEEQEELAETVKTDTLQKDDQTKRNESVDHRE